MDIHDENTTRWTGHGRDMFIEAVALAYTKIFPDRISQDGLTFKGNITFKYYTNSDNNINNDDNKKVWNSYKNDYKSFSDFLADMLLTGENLKNDDFFVIDLVVIKRISYTMHKFGGKYGY